MFSLFLCSNFLAAANNSLTGYLSFTLSFSSPRLHKYFMGISYPSHFNNATIYIFHFSPHSILDINECVSQTGPCERGQVCLNTVGSYTCQRNSVNCGRGYHLNEEGTRCIGKAPSRGNSALLSNNQAYSHFLPRCSLSPDIDECKSPQKVCQGHGCINLLGSYRCECQPGYTFNSISRECEGEESVF